MQEVWKLTVAGDLFAFLLIDVLLDHFIGDGAGAGRQIPSGPLWA